MEAQAAASAEAASTTLPAGESVVPLERAAPRRAARTSAARRDSVRRRSLALADMLGLVGAYLLVWVLDPPPGALGDRLPLLASVPLWVLLNKLIGLYDRDANLINKSMLDELPRIAHSIALGTGAVFLLGGLVFTFPMHRPQALVFAVLALVTVPPLRALARTAVRR